MWSAAFDRGLELDAADHMQWYRAAAVHLAAGDGEGYRRACREMLRRFGNTSQAEVAERTAKTCLLAPDAVADLDHVLKLAELAVTDTERSGYYRWFVFNKALAEYRGGQHAVAVKWLGRFAPRFYGEHIDASAFSVLAMSQHGLGRAEQAEAALTRANEILATMPDPAGGLPFGEDWLEWLHAQILYREAQALLKKESGVKESEKKPQ
jgi:hypothetical protein